MLSKVNDRWNNLQIVLVVYPALRQWNDVIYVEQYASALRHPRPPLIELFNDLHVSTIYRSGNLATCGIMGIMFWPVVLAIQLISYSLLCLSRWRAPDGFLLLKNMCTNSDTEGRFSLCKLNMWKPLTRKM